MWKGILFCDKNQNPVYLSSVQSSFQSLHLILALSIFFLQDTTWQNGGRWRFVSFLSAENIKKISETENENENEPYRTPRVSKVEMWCPAAFTTTQKELRSWRNKSFCLKNVSSSWFHFPLFLSFVQHQCIVQFDLQQKSKYLKVNYNWGWHLKRKKVSHLFYKVTLTIIFLLTSKTFN